METLNKTAYAKNTSSRHPASTAKKAALGATYRILTDWHMLTLNARIERRSRRRIEHRDEGAKAYRQEVSILKNTKPIS